MNMVSITILSIIGVIFLVGIVLLIIFQLEMDNQKKMWVQIDSKTMQEIKQSDLVWITDAVHCDGSFSKCVDKNGIKKTEKQIKDDLLLELFKNDIIVVDTNNRHYLSDCEEGCIPMIYFSFLISKNQKHDAEKLGYY